MVIEIHEFVFEEGCSGVEIMVIKFIGYFVQNTKTMV